jgi:malyl-CoA/(S)-citramalyl-CoA lyase
MSHPDAAGADKAAARPKHQEDPWHYTIAKMVDATASAGIKAFYGPFGDFSDPAASEAQFRNAF